VSQTQRWAVLAAVPLVAIAAVSLAFVVRSSPTSPDDAVDTTAAATWDARQLRAPDFRLADDHGRPISLAGLRGRPVLLTFIDPLCRDFCPTEVQHLSDVVRDAPAGEKPTIVAVSVNTAGNKPSILAVDRRKWNAPSQFRWAVGSHAQLARVWRGYHIDVIESSKTVAGVKVRQIAHTEASYLLDRDGFERALFLWPYTAAAVSRELRALPVSSS